MMHSVTSRRAVSIPGGLWTVPWSPQQEFVTSDETLACAVARELDQVDPPLTFSAPVESFPVTGHIGWMHKSAPSLDVQCDCQMHGPALPLDVHCEWILNGEESEPTLAHIPPSWYYQPVNYSKTPEY